MSAAKEERSYPIRKAAQGCLLAPFWEGSLVPHATGMETRFKREPGALPAGYYSDICEQSAASSVLGAAHKWLHTKKVSLLLTASLSKPRYASGLAWLCKRRGLEQSPSSLKPCGMEDTKPTIHTFFQAKIWIHSSWSLVVSITEVLSLSSGGLYSAAAYSLSLLG